MSLQTTVSTVTGVYSEFQVECVGFGDASRSRIMCFLKWTGPPRWERLYRPPCPPSPVSVQHLGFGDASRSRAMYFLEYNFLQSYMYCRRHRRVMDGDLLADHLVHRQRYLFVRRGNYNLCTCITQRWMVGIFSFRFLFVSGDLLTDHLVHRHRYLFCLWG